MTRFAGKFLHDQNGATAVEYGLLVALLGVVIAAAITGLGDSLWGRFNNIADDLK